MNSRNKKRILYLFPYAGGSSLSYLKWHGCFTNFEIMPLDYSGHGLREKEPFYDTIQDTALDITVQITHSISERNGEVSIALFGHSMGGIIAWHAARNLIEKYDIYPQMLCVSGCSVPSEFAIMDHYGIYANNFQKHVDDHILIDTLLRNERLDKKIVESESFKNRAFPIIHHDYEMIAQYVNKQDNVLPIPIYAFAGENDPLLSIKDAVKWENITSREFKLFIFPGDHYFFEQKEVQCEICKIIDNSIN